MELHGQHVEGSLEGFSVMPLNRKKPSRVPVDRESIFDEIYARYEPQLRSLCFEWSELIKNWDSVFSTINQALRNATDESPLEQPLMSNESEFFRRYRSVTKSLKKELRRAGKGTPRSERKILKKKSKMWLKQVLTGSELSRGWYFASNKTSIRRMRYFRKWNKFQNMKRKSSEMQKKVERERNRERARQVKREREIELTCKTCHHSSAERVAQEEQLKVIQKALLREMKGAGRKLKAEQGVAEALRWNLRFGESALVEMNVRQKEQIQREQTQSYLQWFQLSRCAECQFPYFPKFH